MLISKRVGKSENIGLEKGESFETLVACPHKDFKITRKLVHFQANLDENKNLRFCYIVKTILFVFVHIFIFPLKLLGYCSCEKVIFQKIIPTLVVYDCFCYDLYHVCIM